MEVEEITCKGSDLESIQEYISECASVVRDKTPRSSEKLFNRLLTESYGDKASRVLEYIPCTIDSGKIPYSDGQVFGFFANENWYYTNARELLNWGWNLDKVLDCVDFTDYKVFKCEAPYFIYGQVSTHNQLTTVSHSQRYSECDRGYWKPPEFNHVKQDDWNYMVEHLSPYSLKSRMKDYGVKRKEVFDRGSDMLQNRVFIIGGYINNPNAWPHFIGQRLDKHTQLETSMFVKMIQDKL